MGTVMYACGCSITRSMFGYRQVLGVVHCEKHNSLYSETKTMKEMADEIMALNSKTENEG
jgi:hypothetical protein